MTENAAAGIWNLQQRYISPCLASIGQSLDSCTGLCIGDREERARRQRERERRARRGQAEYSFDFYDDWDDDDDALANSFGGPRPARQLGRRPDRGLGQAPRRHGLVEEPPRGRRRRRRRRRRRGRPAEAEARDELRDARPAPDIQRAGGPHHHPQHGPAGLPRPAAVQDRRHAEVQAQRGKPAGPPGRASVFGRRARAPAGPRQATRTVATAATTASATATSTLHALGREAERPGRATHRARTGPGGDLFPSDGEGDEDAIPIDDEFAMALGRVDDRSSGKTRSSKGKRRADSKPMSRSLSRTSVASQLSGSSLKKRTSNLSLPTLEDTEAVPSLADLQQEEERVQREEDGEVRTEAQGGCEARSRARAEPRPFPVRPGPRSQGRDGPDRGC